MTKAKAAVRFVPQQKFDTVQYLEQDAPEGTVTFTAKIRSNLTFGELNTLVWAKETPMTEMYELFAPFVVEWNLSGVDASGDVVDIPAPAVGGAEQFDYLPIGVFWELVRDIKLRSNRPLDPKRNAPSGDTAKPNNSNGMASGT